VLAVIQFLIKAFAGRTQADAPPAWDGECASARNFEFFGFNGSGPQAPGAFGFGPLRTGFFCAGFFSGGAAGGGTAFPLKLFAAPGTARRSFSGVAEPCFRGFFVPGFFILEFSGFFRGADSGPAFCAGFSFREGPAEPFFAAFLSFRACCHSLRHVLKD